MVGGEGHELSDELTNFTAARLVELMRARAVSPVEVLEAHLRRAGLLNARLNAVVTFAPDAAERAREAEQAIMRGDTGRPLLGLPVTIKDTLDTRGLRTTRGSRVFAEHVPTEDAPAVARLRDAGAIIYGKTNVSELALDYTADNPVFGRTLNPHDPDRTTGGSSGGCAAAVAACLTPVSLGSDMVGSIRIPAHFCGVAGLKPTAGRVVSTGHFPPSEGINSLSATVGPIARTVEDLALIFSALIEAEPGAESARDAYRLLERGPGLRRVVYYTDDGTTPVCADVRRAVVAAAQALSRAAGPGCELIEEVPPGVEGGAGLWHRLFARPVLGLVRATYRGREELAGPAARALLDRREGALEDEKDGDAARDEDEKAAVGERGELLDALARWMETTPIFVAPVGAVAAFEHDARGVEVEGRRLSTFRAFGPAQTFSALGLPVACVPAGRTRGGLPVGVQIVGRPREEWRVLAAARAVERALGGWQPPPISLPTA